MGKNGIIVCLGLDDMLKKSFSGEYQELEKNIGEDKNLLVKDLYNYMINPKKDELNPRDYTPDQIRIVKIVRDAYEPVQNTASIMYKTDTGGEDYMYFNEKLSNYPNAFHKSKENSEDKIEYGVLEECVDSGIEFVHLKATPQDIGGKK